MPNENSKKKTKKNLLKLLKTEKQNKNFESNKIF